NRERTLELIVKSMQTQENWKQSLEAVLPEDAYTLLWAALHTAEGTPDEMTIRLLERAERAMADKPRRSSHALCLLGQVYALEGRELMAITALGQAVELHPQWDAAHFELAKLLRDRGSRREALWHSEQAVRLAPENKRYQTLRNE